MKNIMSIAFLLSASYAFGQDTTKISRQPMNNPDSVYTFVEVMPSFPGGENKLFKFLSKNIKYPVEAYNKNIQGKVQTQFIIEKDGNISNIGILQSVDPLLDSEAMRVIKLMPQWISGKQNGIPARVQYYLPINFVSH